MNAFALRAVAVLVAAGSFVGATAYVVTHPKDPSAPLQPPVADTTSQPVRSATPPPTAPPSGRQVRATVRPAPTITLQPGVRATELPGVTYTHTS